MSCALIALMFTAMPHARAEEPTAASGALVAAQDDPAAAAAARFKRGLQFVEESEYPLALIEFERAYALAPNYRALYNIGLVSVQLGRYAQATRAFERYLRDGADTIPPERRGEVEATLTDLRQRTATIDLKLHTPDAEVILDGKPLQGAALTAPLLVDAGEHTLLVQAPGFRPQTHALTLAAQDRSVWEIVLEPLEKTLAPQQAATPRWRIFWPGVGVTLGLASGAAVAGVLMLNARSDLETLKHAEGSSSGEREDVARRANISALTADILTGLSVLGAGVTVYLSLHRDQSPSEALVGVSPQGLSLSGRF